VQALLSGAAYYVMGLVVKKKGPVFYSAFNPLTTVLVAILGSFFLAEQLYTGRYVIFFLAYSGGDIYFYFFIFFVVWVNTMN
jgi:hypothetical protein